MYNKISCSRNISQFITMKSYSDLLIGICILLFTSPCRSKSEETCSSPDFPVGGNYSRWLNKFQAGDTVTYYCDEGHILMGKDTSKCSSNGEWTNPTPFCDAKAPLRYAYASLTSSVQLVIKNVTDEDRNTCFGLKTGEKIDVSVSKKKEVYAVRLFVGRGEAKFEVLAGNAKCGDNDVKYIATSQWVTIKCNTNGSTNAVVIKNKADKNVNITICEIEVYLKQDQDDGCEKTPDRKVSNGYLEVSRSKATLICDEGYKSEHKRVVCEKNEWKGNRLQCEEILCNPVLNFTKAPGSDWVFLDPVTKVSAGTRRQLKCGTGYKKLGGPDIIVCQKDGTWTKTNVTCVEKKKPEYDTKSLVFVGIGIVVVLIIIALLGTTIYFVRKQRNRQVVVVYKQPTEGSIVSGSSGDYASAHYETIQGIGPVPPPPSRQIPQILSDGYSLPSDSKDTLRKKPMPADIAFSPLKQSSLYNF